MNYEQRTTGNKQLATKCEIRDTRYAILIVMQNKPNFKLRQNERNLLYPKGLYQRTTNNEQ